MLSVAALVAALVGAQFLAVAPSDVICPPGSSECFVEVVEPGKPGRPGDPDDPTNPGGERRCVISSTGKELPCYSEVYGWFNEADECYWLRLDPQPEDGAWWDGHYPEGAVYAVNCFYGGSGPKTGWLWRATPPPGYGGGGPTPVQLAQRAIERMSLRGPEIRMTIEDPEIAVVGVPVWLWTEVGPTTWGPNTVSASVPGLSVTATAKARQIEWAMGDGRSQVCANPGTPYTAGSVTSPTCQHVYEKASVGQPGERFPVTATTTWDVTWSGGGQSGALTVTRESTATIRVGEVQVLVTQQ